MTRRSLPLVLGVAVSIALVSGVLARSQPQSAVSAVAIDADDIGGVVTGPAGPEAGVWVIAETRDLAVRYIKTVVTDDRGRFVVPDLPKATYTRVGARLWPGRQRQGHGRSRVNGWRSPPRSRRARPPPRTTIPPSTGTRCSTSRRLTSSAARARFPARMSQRQWISAMKNTGCVGLPPARPALHAHRAGRPRHVCHRCRCLAAPRAVGAIGADDAQPADEPGRRVVCQVRRVDRSHRQGRAAVCHAGAPAGRRAQRGRHAARLDEREAVSARPHRQRSPAPHGERLRPALRVARVQLRHAAHARSGEERRHDLQGAGARSADAAQPRPGPCRGTRRPAALALLGQRAYLGHAGQQPQLDVRPRRPALARRVGARRRQPGLVQGRLRPSVGQGVSDGPRRAPSGGAEPEDDEVRLHRDVLLHPSPAVRLRRQRHAVDERRRAGGGLAQHEDARRHRRRRPVARLDRARARHQRQREARRLCGAECAGRSRQGHAHQRAVLRGDAESRRRLGVGRRC